MSSDKISLTSKQIQKSLILTSNELLMLRNFIGNILQELNLMDTKEFNDKFNQYCKDNSDEAMKYTLSAIDKTK